MWGVRNGYSDLVVRQDLLYIKNGKARNKTIMPYDNEWSAPECFYIPISDKPLVIKNLR